MVEERGPGAPGTGEGAGGGAGGGTGRGSKTEWRVIAVGLGVVGVALATFVVAALLVNIQTRRAEELTPFVRLVEVTEDTTDPAVWGQNWPMHYDAYRQTVDSERTRYGGSDAIPRQKLDENPWLRLMWSGYAFSIDYREARGHAYMLIDQEQTERVLQRPQPGACLHCHSSVMKAYRHVGEGDVMEGFRRVSAMSWQEARNLTDAHGEMLIQHPASCVDCHDPSTMALRVTRPAFIEGIRALKAHEGIANYDVNRDATRQEMRTFACAQCHVEYYFKPEGKTVTYPWAQGIKVEEIESYYNSIGFSDWTHGVTGAPVLKAQHPEFELFSQGIHARAGVSCADCHMPYRRVGAMKISDHHVRSPLLNIAASCQTCHNVPEQELLSRAHAIQDRTVALIERAAKALEDMILEIAAAKEAGATDEQLRDAYRFQRSAQFRLDFIYSENSHGFHADQEAARILAESIDMSRQGQLAAKGVRAGPRPDLPEPIGEPVRGVTPTEQAPPGPYQHDPQRRGV